MPSPAPQCPFCLYDLSGVAPIEQADPTGTAPFTCPECGGTVTMISALNINEPDPHPLLLGAQMVILGVVWLLICGGCAGALLMGWR